MAGGAAWKALHGPDCCRDWCWSRWDLGELVGPTSAGPGRASEMGGSCQWFNAKATLALAQELPLFSINSLAPGRSECDSKNVIFNLVLLIGIFRCSHHNALRWMPRDLTDHKSTLVQVMDWCRQATSHYLSQCWLSSLTLYGIARPQWVKPSMCLGIHTS